MYRFCDEFAVGREYYAYPTVVIELKLVLV